MTVFEMSEESLLEQLLEECGELIQAAAKRLRILRNESPTPVTEEENKAQLNEEAADVSLIINVLCMTGNLNSASLTNTAISKYRRWKYRLEQMETKENEK